MTSRHVTRIIEETTPVIILYGLLELFAGGILREMTSEISILPGLLIIVPPLLAMRGNISSALGARLSSSLHLGYVRFGKLTNDLKTNVYSALILNLFMSFVLATFAWITFSITGLPHMSILALYSVTVLTGFLSGLALVFVAVFVSMISYKEGLDPDNITTPSIASFGDIITVLMLFLIVRIVIGFGI